MEYLIKVRYKPGFFDALGNTVQRDIKDLGISGVKKVKTAQLYYVEGEITYKELRLLCKELLADTITQQYEITSSRTSFKTNNKQTFIVQVWYKKGVTDAVADTVKKGAMDLGIQKIDKVKTGYEYIILGNISRAEIERICRGLLANKVVQEYKIYPEGIA